jgi:hypothetical protein
LRLTEGGRDDAAMKSARTHLPLPATLAVCGAALLCGALLAGASLTRCSDPEERAPVVVPSDVHLAGVAPQAAPQPPGDATVLALSADAGRLGAARTVALYCRLIDAGQFARAGELCGARRLWSRRVLRSVRSFRFRSARVYAAPDARSLVLKARVRVRAGRRCPLPGGLSVVFFTLGRDGSTAGGWRITAVSTCP